MTSQTANIRFGTFDAEVTGNALCALLLEYVECPGVLVVSDPGGELVLPHTAARRRLQAAVTGTAGTRGAAGNLFGEPRMTLGSVLGRFGRYRSGLTRRQIFADKDGANDQETYNKP
jgi:hypothetical protein